MTRAKLTIIFIAIVAALIVTGAVVSLLLPSEPNIARTPTVTTNFDRTTSGFSNVRYVGQQPRFPERLTVFATQQTISQDAVIPVLTERYGLRQLPGTDNVWRGSDNELLAIDQVTGQASLSIRPALPIKDPLKNRQRLIDDSRQHLQNFFPNLALEVLGDQLVFTGEYEGLEPIEFIDSTGLLVPYGYQFDGVPLAQDLSGQAVVTIGVDRGGELISLTFTDQLLGFSPLGEKSLISLDQAVSNINSDQALIGGARPTQNVGIELDSITSASLETIRLEYRLDPDNNLTYPFYRFTGRGTNSRGDQLELEVVTPAVVVN